ncbi:MAG: phenylalanine--tRNA ligase subunit beta [Candidatus Methylacidiphilales bacterium]|nr:phenylalanine--tRNA ligase subunit beta [Candidatus Methylacidiphilales bacterium]
MKVALSWLRDHVAWDWSTDELVQKLTMSGTEVEAVHATGFDRDGFVAAKILASVQHPNADRLSVCQVDDGSGQPRQIVCGAKNYQVGDVVPLALPGTVMPGGFEIKDSKLRGERSSGMMCSAKELGLAEDAEGLLILDPAVAPGTPVKSLFTGDTVMELEVTPNRADLLSYRGLARELAALGATPKPAAPVRNFSNLPASSDWSLQVENPDRCPHYAFRVLKNVQVGPSPEWLRQRLESIGLRAVNNVVDITNFVLFELGQPMHAFDADKFQGRTVHVRQAGEGEKLKAINARDYLLTPDDLVIADASGPVAIAGVMGGLETEVSAATRTILLECARFQPAGVRRTSRRLQLLSDSSYRFERGLDPRLVAAALDRATELLIEIAGAVCDSLPAASQPTPAVEDRILPLSPASITRVLGFPVEPARVNAILTGLGLTPAASPSDPGWQVPSYRPDLAREIDLIEEVARIVGLDQAPSALPPGVATHGPADKRYDFERALKHHLCALGLHEMASTTFTPASLPVESEAVAILNPLNEDNARVRSNLLDTLLPCVRHNLAHGNTTFRGFEIGPVSRRTGKGSEEERRLAILLVGDERPAHWTEPARPADFFTLQGVVEALRTAFPVLGQPAFMGDVPAERRKAHGLKAVVYAAEWTLPAETATPAPRYQPLPQFPAVKRDLSFVVDRSVSQASLSAAIRGAGVRELETVECFDLFQDDSGAKLPAGKKALAYALTYRSPERTLGEKDVNGWESAIIQAVAQKAGGELRK